MMWRVSTATPPARRPRGSPPFGAITPGAPLGTLQARLARALQFYTYLSKLPCAACAVRPLFMDFVDPPLFRVLATRRGEGVAASG
jgi:hypothetical protein